MKHISEHLTAALAQVAPAPGERHSGPIHVRFAGPYHEVEQMIRLWEREYPREGYGTRLLSLEKKDDGWYEAVMRRWPSCD